ncbi:16S rRNA (guanine(966)-N(2))-methyltransferase RsmD [Rhodoferax sp. TS-BS-61-7]|uniref:16S rRNA (guanine(966)-N(2))-methyltransferase RsmD n=1 Tax=Rhodoferax sp. TS-BS-61-7 TaxID=2094194 RepID=UPI000CF608D3|nr:16S rRNA (guanine(966)-N(2))-methyltransferase RsmD [Rhodoferax sp. TS-BS-61-7]PQA77556.1 16S rRNA (guanine(966)-N(2))-methyltransferase RsmD [Rhodoferax sp. TS-BS-61-7]
MKAKAPKPNAAKRPPRPRAVQTHEIRIIGGLWKRTKLKVADKPGLRPTPDRVRETVFNWLGQDLSGLRCLDAFAGTGALGFEAASRGAQEVQLVEYDSALADQLKKTQTQLQASAVHVVRGDGVSAIRQAAPGSLDVIFIDPPFDAPLFEPALGACARALAPEGWVYLEAPIAYTDELLTAVGLTVHRHLKAGAVHAHLLKRSAA